MEPQTIDELIEGAYSIFNVFTDGNYKVHHDYSREELTDMGTISSRMGKNFIQSGYDIQDDNPKSLHRVIDFKGKLNRDESITVEMSNAGEYLCRFIFTRTAIMSFVHDYPIRNQDGEVIEGRYAICNHFGVFQRAKNALCLGKRDTVIDYHAPIEYINEVELIKGFDTREWNFYGTREDGSDIDVSPTATKYRYCAFMEAIRTALIACSRDTAYADLYRATCFSAT